MSEPRRCSETAKNGQPCPAPPLRRRDPDGVSRCVQHSARPEVRERLALARKVGGLRSTNQALPEIVHAYDSKQDLDGLVDFTINALLSRRMKPNVAVAIFQGVATRVKLAELEAAARLLQRMKSGARREVAAA